MIERRDPSKFIERLSITLVIVSSIGAILVLVDPRVSFTTAAGTFINIGGNGFSDQLKGAVISLILVSGFAAVIGYWLGATKQGQEQAQAMTRLAEAPVAGAPGAVTPAPATETGVIPAAEVAKP